MHVFCNGVISNLGRSIGGGQMQIARRLSFPSENSGNPFTHPKRVYTEISSFVRRSKVYGRGKSFAASVPSDNSKVQKARKRVPKDERQAMVQSFVNKYREMNAGKFPTTTDAMKQVGGGYYQIRKILQEIEYKSKICPVNTRIKNVVGTEFVEGNEASTYMEEVSISLLRGDAGSHENGQAVAGIDIGDSRLQNAGADEGAETVPIFEKTLTDDASKPTMRDNSSSFDGKQIHVSNEEVFHRNAESPEDVLDLEVQKPKREQTDDQELPKKQSVWENIKSLADGFINMWKKL